MRDAEKIVKALRRVKVETGSLVCLGCGHEHNCGMHGCAIMQEAADLMENQQSHIAALQKKVESLKERLELSNAERNANTKRMIELEQGQKWIPVTERLPEKWVDAETKELVNYLIFSPDFGVDIGNYHAKAKKWLCMDLPCTVTHWAPLPEAPEVE